MSDEGERCDAILSSWRREELSLKERLLVDDGIAYEENSDLFNRLHYVGGLDISFVRDEPEPDLVHATATLIVTSYPELEVVAEKTRMIHVKVPYISSFLGFREADPLLNIVREFQNENPELSPQVLIYDGNGIMHPRGFGAACHIGVQLDLPSIGVAKKLLHVDGLENSPEHKQKIIDELKEGGDFFPLIGNSGKIHGNALRATDAAKNPVYVSVGHKIKLSTATQLVTECSNHRVVEPVRMADIKSRKYQKDHYKDHLSTCTENWKELTEHFEILRELARERLRSIANDEVE